MTFVVLVSIAQVVFMILGGRALYVLVRRHRARELAEMQIVSSKQHIDGVLAASAVQMKQAAGTIYYSPRHGSDD